MSSRIKCSNPRCNRTADAEKFGPEMVCAKCWKLVPIPLKKRYRDLRKRYTKLERYFSSKKSEHIPHDRALSMQDTMHKLLASNWRQIVAIFQESEKPEGLDNFLEEAGLNG